MQRFTDVRSSHMFREKSIPANASLSLRYISSSLQLSVLQAQNECCRVHGTFLFNSFHVML